jgi:hypothetical protein
MKTKDSGLKLILLGILFLIVFSYPFITIANKTRFIAGLPVLYLYIFVVWGITIFLVFLIADSKYRKPDE